MANICKTNDGETHQGGLRRSPRAAGTQRNRKNVVLCGLELGTATMSHVTSLFSVGGSFFVYRGRLGLTLQGPF